VIRHLVAVGFGALVWTLTLSPSARGDGPNGTGRRGTEPVSVEVFYATNRARAVNGLLADDYGGARGVPQFGRCRVDFTPIPGMNRVTDKLSFYLPNETNDVGAVIQDDPEHFWSQIESAVDKSASQSLVVFVHGYNYGFARTCRMAAEFRRDLGDGAALVMLSWPANGLPTDYVQDLADVEWSVPFIADFLEQTEARIGGGRVQLVAHSLGARGATLALQRLRADRGDAPVIGRLVLLAPDLDAQTFVELLPRITSAPAAVDAPITLYASDKDTPLMLSRQLSGYPRLGEGGELLTVVDGMESIDVSEVGRYQIFGHEYFFYHPLVAADLVELITTGRSAARRAGLQATEQAGRTFWRIRPRETR